MYIPDKILRHPKQIFKKNPEFDPSDKNMNTREMEPM